MIRAGSISDQERYEKIFKRCERDVKSSITKTIEEVKSDICNNYCKYPFEPVPEGKSPDWLWDDPESPCNNCPLERL